MSKFNFSLIQMDLKAVVRCRQKNVWFND